MIRANAFQKRRGGGRAFLPPFFRRARTRTPTSPERLTVEKTLLLFYFVSLILSCLVKRESNETTSCIPTFILYGILRPFPFLDFASVMIAGIGELYMNTRVRLIVKLYPRIYTYLKFVATPPFYFPFTTIALHPVGICGIAVFAAPPNPIITFSVLLSAIIFNQYLNAAI
jgi:hypothetical protein